MEKITAKELTDKGICPTCYDRAHGNCVFGDNSEDMILKNDVFECFLCDRPRADGHMIISSEKHFKDIMEAPWDVCEKMLKFAKFMMIAIKDVYGCESVYLCTMCDGPMNHFHLQLIPRYDFEERGSKNFVKERKKYVRDYDKIKKLCEIAKTYEKQGE